MKAVIILVLTGVGMIIDVVIGSWMLMALSAFLHSNWWAEVPALNFGASALVAILLFVFSAMTNMHDSDHNWGSAIVRVILGLGLAPLVLCWVIGELNNSLITVLPDITYGTSLILALIGLSIAAVKAIISVGFSKIVTSVLE